jgi:hypothetical protein
MMNEVEAQAPAGRPTLVIGSTERAIEDIRASATADTSALLKAEIERCRGAVRQAFDGIKDALAGFERSCNQSLGAGSAEASAALAGVVERLVAAATAASEAAAHRARAEARVEIDELQGVLAKLREAQDLDRQQLESLTGEFETTSAKLTAAAGEVTTLTAQLKTATDELAAERTQAQTARATAESALKQAEEERRGLVAAHEGQVQTLQADVESLRGELSRLQRQAEAERAERARLVAAIQQVVAPGDLAVAVPVAAPVATPEPPPAPPVVEKPAAAVASALEMPPPPSSDPGLVIYVEHLLKTVESMYAEDVAARRKPDDVLNRLTDNLRSARNVFRNHVGASDPEELTLFDYQLTKILNTTEDTAFGRHLGIAAYECQKARKS